LLTQVGRFTDEENNMTYKYLTQLPKPKFMEMLEEDAKAAGLAAGLAVGKATGLAEGKAEGKAEGRAEGIEQGIAEGIRAKALEDARKLVEHGVSWEIITSATGVKPEDLEAK
jgi:predicted transposase YdaD